MSTNESVPDERLAAAYELAWQEWDEQGDAELWDVTVADGLSPVRLTDST